MVRTKITPNVISGKQFVNFAPRSNKYKLVYLAGVVTTVAAILLVNWFNNNYRLQSPIMIQSPVVPLTTTTPTPSSTPTSTPTNTPSVAPKRKASVDRIVDVVYRLESSQGKHDPCAIKGRYNGFGMAPGTCYDSHEEVRNKVVSWFDKCMNKNGYSLSHCACSYNLGPNSPYKSACEQLSSDYPYYKNLLSYL